ncbi:uncharacterized protein SAPINGB_P000622 [Magnusiomyces paraingens]|uniref:Glycosyltransferase family 15 protein n=1 Tax=Magnusiomyces paraingens TaxID=2606893 RepID=A0A5E8B0P5_9ASCO|nr:uncharacterized protein SAPINGB_P000622 [Saprochaete ingens]VVT45054.1 unnamed protein product [Saprochaete ingens]
MSRGIIRSGRMAILLLVVIFIIYEFSYGHSLAILSESDSFKYFRQRIKGDSGSPATNQYTDMTSPIGKPYERANATFVTLARNSDLYALLDSIQSVEDRFNRKFHYDWIFFNDEEFDAKFKEVIGDVVSGSVSFHTIPKEFWGYPDWIDQEKAAAGRKEMQEKGIIYAESESYRHMCRFESGFFWRHPAMNKYRYYWRVEPDVKYFCDIDYDIFKFMEDKNIKYGFTISLYEFVETIRTLWDTTKKFLETHSEYVAKNNLLNFISEDKGESYNLCHFWSNFEIADMDFWRGEAYTKYFTYLDKAGGFFYERWGDAPVHSIAASLFLDKSEIHHFEDIGYRHGPYTSCPSSLSMRKKGHCTCNPDHNFSWDGYSCFKQYYRAQEQTLPKIS